MMTVPQLFLSVLGFILFIVLGIVFIHSSMGNLTPAQTAEGAAGRVRAIAALS